MVRTSHGSDGPVVVGHRALRVLDVPGRRQGGVAAPRVHVDVHRLDVRVDRIFRVSGRSEATITDFFDANIVQQESSLTADSADSDDRCRVAGYEVIHVLLPLYGGYCNNICRMEAWQPGVTKLLGMETAIVRRADVERHSILLRLHR